MKRILKVSYKTAWYLCHRIRAAMIEAGKSKLTGTFEVDETYVGGKKHGIGQSPDKAEKEVVMDIRQRNGDLRFLHVEDAKTGTLAKYIRENKRGIMGTWHKVSAKHLAAYLDEMTFRFNNRKNPFLFRDTMLKLIESPNLEYKKLTSNVKNVA